MSPDVRHAATRNTGEIAGKKSAAAGKNIPVSLHFPAIFRQVAAAVGEAATKEFSSGPAQAFTNSQRDTGEAIDG